MSLPLPVGWPAALLSTLGAAALVGCVSAETSRALDRSYHDAGLLLQGSAREDDASRA